MSPIFGGISATLSQRPLLERISVCGGCERELEYGRAQLNMQVWDSQPFSENAFVGLVNLRMCIRMLRF